MAEKWYVNLVQTDKLENAGMEYKISIAAKNWGFKNLQSTSKDSMEVEWKLDVKADSVKSTELTIPQKPLAHDSTVADKNNDFLNVLKLPHSGGDLFTVKAKTKSANDYTDIAELETWRRIYYSFFT